MRKRSIARVVSVLWTACIVVGTLGRGSGVGQHLTTHGTKHLWAHLLVFGVLGALQTVSFTRLQQQQRALTAAAVLGVVTEIYEHFAFHGHVEWKDIACNVIGVLVGGWIALRMERRQQQR